MTNRDKVLFAYKATCALAEHKGVLDKHEAFLKGECHDYLEKIAKASPDRKMADSITADAISFFDGYEACLSNS